MQQLVSYQTARRIYGERSYKKYVTKRTCISLTFSIGFFTLIVGFLLGKFVSHRQYKLRHLYEPEVMQLIRSIPQVKEAAENMLGLQHFNNETTSLFNNTMVEYDQINSNLLGKMEHCGKALTFNLFLDSGYFIAQLLDDEVVRLLNCLKEVNKLLDALKQDVVELN